MKEPSQTNNKIDIDQLLAEFARSSQANRLRSEGRDRPHVEDGQLRRFDAGELSEQENRQIRTHILFCGDCGRRLLVLRNPWKHFWRTVTAAVQSFCSGLGDWLYWAVTIRAPLPVAALFLLVVLMGAVGVGTYTALLSQFNDLVRQLHFDKPFEPRLSAVGQRSLQLDLSLHKDVVREAFVDWGDPSSPDPVGGTRIYPTAEGIETGQEKLLLPPITHEYGSVPREGLRTTVRVRIVPTTLPEVRPEPLIEANLNPSRRIWVLTYGIVLDPPEAELSVISPKAGEIITPTTEVQVRAGALTADIHFLALDPANPTIYRYLGKMPPPPLGQEAKFTHVLDTSRLGLSGPFRLVVVSTNQLEPAADGTVEWRAISQAVPRDEVEVRHAGVILSPTQGMEVLSDIETVRAKVVLPNTYAAAVICAKQAAGACFVQNDGLAVAPFTEFSIQAFYAGPDTYEVYLGITQDPNLFERGGRLTPRPLSDREGRPVFWIGPVEVTRR